MNKHEIDNLGSIDHLSKFSNAVNAGASMAIDLLTSYEEKIRRAYLMSGDDALKVNLTISLKPFGESIEVDTAISFVESKVKDSSKRVVSEQKELPLESTT